MRKLLWGLTGLFLWLVLATGSPAWAQVANTNCVTVICPPNLTNYTCGDQVQITNYPVVVSNDCPGVTVSVVCNPPLPVVFGLGVHPVHCAVLLGTQIVGSCDFTVTVLQDTQPPRIFCPSNVVAHTCQTAAGGCGTIVTYPPVLATDNSGLVAVVCHPPSGSYFNCGSSNVVCIATDRCNNKASCQFVVTVVADGHPPVIQCPPDQVIRICTNSVAITYPMPTVMPAGTPIICNPPVGTVLPLGLHVVNCVASNNCGTAECAFTLSIEQLPPPHLPCPTAPLVVTLPCGTNCVPVVYPVPTLPDGTASICTPPSGTCLSVGSHPVVCTVSTDCGTATCQFVINVQQGQGNPPGIQCSADITVTTCSNCAPVTYPAPVVNNGVLVGCNPPSGFCFPLGVTTVKCLATNDCGRAECSFSVIVRPVPPVSIQCPTNPVIATVPCGSNCVPVFYPAPAVLNGALIGCNPPSGTCLPAGNYSVICRASNQCDTVACEFPIHVQQGQGNPPGIQCPADITVTTCSNCAPVTYAAPIVNNGVLVGCNPPSGICFPLGVTPVTCLATNDCGGSATCKFNVIVRPVPPVSIQCPTNPVIATVPCGSNCVPVFYPAPTVLNGALIGCNPPSGSCLPAGNYFVICRASNECGVVACEFPVHVQQGNDNPPVIHCPTKIAVATCHDCEVVNYPAPTVVNGTLVGCNPPSGTCFPLGVTTVTCLATNPCGSAQCSFTVTVTSVPVPTIICPSNMVVTTCGQGEFVTYPPPVIPTSYPSNLTVICVPPSGSFFPLGTNFVRCCVIDRCQRTNCCTFEIDVVPGRPCVKPPLNMVLWLPFDETVPPIAHNIIAGAPNGVHVNGPVPLLGQKVLNSLGFDGVNDYVRVLNYAAIQLSTSDFSIDAWVLRRDTGGRRVIVSKLGTVFGAAAPRGYEYYLNNGLMNLLISGPASQNFNSGVAVPLDNNWHHVAVTVRRGVNGAVRFYLDGVQVNVQNSAITAPISSSSPLYVGAGTWPAPNSFFRGFIDEVEIFNRVLTAAQIQSLWWADRAGKCKVKVTIPRNVPIPAGVNCVTVQAQFCNYTPVPLPGTWTANGAMSITPASGTVIIPPFSCINVPITVCRPPTNFPPGAVAQWTITFQPFGGCPIVSLGSIVNPGPIIVWPTDPVVVAGTNIAANLRLTLNGLPPGVPVRLRALNPDGEPDLDFVSLNGLPPGTPYLFGGGAAAESDEAPAVPIRFVNSDSSGDYTVVIEADLDGDGTWESLSSFELSNPVVPPPTVKIVPGASGPVFDWDDQGDGVLEEATSMDGPWTPVPGARPGQPLDTSGPIKFYRVSTPGE